MASYNIPREESQECTVSRKDHGYCILGWKWCLRYLVNLLPWKTTVNSGCYTKTVKSKCLLSSSSSKNKSKVSLFRENARPHTSVSNNEVITIFGWTVLPHPPQSGFRMFHEDHQQRCRPQLTVNYAFHNVVVKFCEIFTCLFVCRMEWKNKSH